MMPGHWYLLGLVSGVAIALVAVVLIVGSMWAGIKSFVLHQHR